MSFIFEVFFWTIILLSLFKKAFLFKVFYLLDHSPIGLHVPSKEAVKKDIGTP